ncbi:MAG: J domain-containing protein [Pseudomonadota bacterium]
MGRDHVVMPFSCTLVGNEVRVAPSTPHYYAIDGQQRVRVFEICDPETGENCRNLSVHKFQVACEGGAVSWARVARAAAGLLGGGARLRRGQLLFQFRGRLRPWGHPPCLRGAWPSRDHPVVPPADSFPNTGCEATGVFEPLAPYLAFPQGFAPLTELGARVIPASSDRFATAIGSVPPRPEPSSRRVNRVAALATLVPAVAGPPAPESLQQTSAGTSVASAPAPAPKDSTQSQFWLTLVEIPAPLPADADAANLLSQRAFAGMLIIIALLAGMLSSVGWWYVQNRRPPYRPLDAYELIIRRDGIDLTRPHAQICSDLCRSAQELIEQVHIRAGDLKGVAPLRRTLLREVRDMEHFLASLITTSPADDTEWRRMRAKLQRVVTDMMRMQDIVESAHRSLTEAPVNRGVPRDRNEALEVLGANEHASDRILKRLVDALRATWHPDHAVDEDDRVAREDRIKQINVAWDLLSGKRVEA